MAEFCSACLADHFGRAKTLVFTILIYALFTGLAALSQTWWQLALFRFITALGIGGEWAAGAALVAEVWPEDKRTRAAGLLQSAWAGGFLVAAVLSLLLRNYGWRPMFVVGVAPAIVAVFVFLWVKEPERWVKARAEEQQTGDRRVRRNWRSCLRRDWCAPRWSVPGWRLWLCSVCGVPRTGRRRSFALCRICTA